MPSPGFKCNLFFTSFQQVATGWSEVYYNESTTINAALGEMEDLCTIRQKLLAPPNRLLLARVSDLNVKGDSLIFVPPGPGAGGQAPQAQPPISEDYYFIAWLVRFETTDGVYHTNHYLGGVDDEGGTLSAYNFTGNQAKAFKALQGQLESGGHWRQLNKDKTTHVPTFHNINDVVFVRAVMKKRGRPFGSPRGRKFTCKPKTI